MKKISSLKKYLSAIYERHESRCLWFSGGADSRLLLEVMLEMMESFGVLRFDDGFGKSQRKIVNSVIAEKNLQVYSYPPRASFLIGDGTDISLAAYYAVDARRNCAVVLRDLVPGDKCAFDIKIETAKIPYAPAEFDAHIWGTRFEDRHFAHDGKLLEKKNWMVGQKQFYAPLADWTRSDVSEALKTFGIDYAAPDERNETGNISCCFNCLQSEKKEVFCPKEQKIIPTVKWKREENLETFRQGLKILES